MKPNKQKKQEKKIEKLIEKVKFAPPGYMEKEWAEILYLETKSLIDAVNKLQEKKEVKTHPYTAIYFRYPSTHEQIKSQPGNYVRGDDYKLYKLWLS